MNELALTVDQWADSINGHWRASAEAIIRTGQEIAAAKAALEAEAFADLLAKLPFEVSAARKLMAIARDERLRSHGNLPASWTTLYQATKLTDDELKDVGPGTERKELEQLARKKRRAEKLAKIQEATNQAEDLDELRLYPVIYADPPWRFDVRGRETGLDRAADNHYPTMSINDVKMMAPPAAADAVLFLWATVPMLVQALDVMDSWGFEYKSHMIWIKNRVGTGYWVRNVHELLLIGTRGSIPAPMQGEQMTSVIQHDVAEHSAKPAAFRNYIDALYPGLSKLEMYCRGAPAEGWQGWGNQVDAEPAPKEKPGTEAGGVAGRLCT